MQDELQSDLETAQVGFGLSGFLLPAFCHWRLLKPEGIDAVLNALLAANGLVAFTLGIQDALS